MSEERLVRELKELKLEYSEVMLYLIVKAHELFVSGIYDDIKYMYAALALLNNTYYTIPEAFKSKNNSETFKEIKSQLQDELNELDKQCEELRNELYNKYSKERGNLLELAKRKDLEERVEEEVTKFYEDKYREILAFYFPRLLNLIVNILHRNHVLIRAREIPLYKLD